MQKYDKTEWIANETLVTAEKLNKVENQLESLTDNSLDLNKDFIKFNLQLDNKANKNEVFSMANMGQDIKEAMTGGSVAVVGDNAILENNIVDEQVTQRKTNFASMDRENYFYNNSLRWVTQNGSSFTVSKNITNRFMGEVYLEPNTTYNLVCFDSSISLYLAEIYSDTELVQNILTSSTIFSSTGLTFTTSSTISKGIYHLLFRNVNNWDKDDYITKYKYRLTKGKLLVDCPQKETDITLIDGLNIKEDNLKSFINNFNVQPSNWRYNIALSMVGSESPSSTQDTTYLLPCFEDFDYYISHSLWVCFYDINGNIIGERQIPQSYDIKIGRGYLHSPIGAKYLRFTVDKNIDKNTIICIPTINKSPYTLENANKKTISCNLLPQYNIEKSRFNNKKMVTDGDSLVAQGRWQSKVADALGMTFLKNCGVPGTKVTSMCSDSRVEQIPDGTEVLYLLAGRNDFGQTRNATPLGTINDEHTPATFYGAYQLWLDKIFTKLPDVKIIILIPPYAADENTPNHLGFYLEQYRQAEREIAYKYGCKIADLRGNMNINHINYSKYYEDDIHFNDLGGKIVAEVAIGASLDIEVLY